MQISPQRSAQGQKHELWSDTHLNQTLIQALLLISYVILCKSFMSELQAPYPLKRHNNIYILRLKWDVLKASRTRLSIQKYFSFTGCFPYVQHSSKLFLQSTPIILNNFKSSLLLFALLLFLLYTLKNKLRFGNVKKKKGISKRAFAHRLPNFETQAVNYYAFGLNKYLEYLELGSIHYSPQAEDQI